MSCPNSCENPNPCTQPNCACCDLLTGYQRALGGFDLQPPMVGGAEDAVGLMGHALHLGAETGEVQQDIMKAMRKWASEDYSPDYNPFTDPGFVARVAEELGDVLAMVSLIASRLNINLPDLFVANQDKLENRHG